MPATTIFTEQRLSILHPSTPLNWADTDCLIGSDCAIMIAQLLEIGQSVLESMLSGVVS